MRRVIDLYGEVVSYAIIAIILMVTTLGGIRLWFQHSLQGMREGEVSYINEKDEEPIIIAEFIEVKVKVDTQEASTYEIDFEKHIQAYSDSTKQTKIPLEIYGKEQVNLREKGIYFILCKAVNEEDNSYVKKVPILVY